MDIKKKEKNGFTLIEVLLIVAVFVILLAGSVSLVNNRVNQEDLTYKVKQVADMVAKAQNYSMTGYRDDVWGIKVLDSDSHCADSADCVVMYKGVIYSDRDASFDQVVELSGTTGVYLEASQVNEFYFAPSSGWLATTTGTSTDQWIVLKSNFGDQKSVVVNTSGVTSIFSCGESQMFDDQGNAYDTVKIGSQCWMAQNLNIGTMLASAATDPTDNGLIEKWCNGDSSANCAVTGGLYHWDEAMGYVTTEGARGICPAGWHIPSDSQLDILEANYSSASDGTELKIGGSSGFNLLESNEMNTVTDTYDDADISALWSSTDNDAAPTEAYVHYTDTLTATMDETSNSQAWGFSIRCLKNY
ncbi:prepilin-type N-terminal cleavage/methylation domain-containing protein [Patescibacteria group bacterium]|nr:prepilin-type N-terminal cleavage/methylation domain-containing protein [Patescibacteria group bacterium]